MTRLLFGLGIFLIAWGAFVLVTGDFVATLDIAASLVASGIGVLALATVARSLEKIASQLAERTVERPSERPVEQPVIQRPVERPRLPGQAPQAELPPPEARRREAPPEPVQPRRDQPEPERRPSEPPAAPPEPRRAPAGEPASAVVREGVIEGQHFRFYADGSIEAEGPRGIRRYRSIDEAREQIMRDREQSQQNQKPNPPPPPGRNEPGRGEPPPPNRRPIEEIPARRPEEPPRPPRMLAEANENTGAPRPAAKPDQDLTWESYLAGGRKGPAPETARPSEDDEWSEPFRMLLKGDAAAADPKGPKR